MRDAVDHRGYRSARAGEEARAPDRRISLTGAVKHAVREKLARLDTARCGRALADEPDDIALRCADLPRRDGRRADEIVGYDDGLTA